MICKYLLANIYASIYLRKYISGSILTKCGWDKDIARRTQGEDKENTRRRQVK
jgi:hypothetical protein